ncbi:hypothetical protein HYS91_02625 [Candidatus Daviesbacteria bacterium]|nr:hypothetical protein [Candidatus Daviesbacteria bacterium]
MTLLEKIRNSQIGQLLDRKNFKNLVIVVILLLLLPIALFLISQQAKYKSQAATAGVQVARDNRIQKDSNPPVALGDEIGLILTSPFDVPGGNQAGGQPVSSQTQSGLDAAKIARCEAIPHCSGANCTFEVKFYKNGQKQSSGYEIAWEANAGDARFTKQDPSKPAGSCNKDHPENCIPESGDPKAISGWLSLTTPNDKGDVATDSKVSIDYGNAAEGPYTAKFNIRTNDDPGLFASCQVRVLSPGGIASGTGADIGYNCSRACNGQIRVHVFEDLNGNKKLDNDPSIDDVLNGAKVKIVSTDDSRDHVEITRITQDRGRAYFDCIPAKQVSLKPNCIPNDKDDCTTNDGIKYSVTLQSVPSGHSLPSVNVSTSPNLDSCNDTDDVNFPLPPSFGANR